MDCGWGSRSRAIVYYATTDAVRNGGFPGGINALWHTYASISTNALGPNPTWTQVQVDEHTMHRSTVCTGGFPGCLTANSDRSMADFFASIKTLKVAFSSPTNENSDLSQVAPGEYIGKPINAKGPFSLHRACLLRRKAISCRSDPQTGECCYHFLFRCNAGTLTVQGTHGLPPGNWASDAAGDAKFPVVPVASANHPALDVLETSLSDNGTNLTVTMKMADLSPTARRTRHRLVVCRPGWWFCGEGKNGLGPPV